MARPPLSTHRLPLLLYGCYRSSRDILGSIDEHAFCFNALAAENAGNSLQRVLTASSYSYAFPEFLPFCDAGDQIVPAILLHMTVDF